MAKAASSNNIKKVSVRMYCMGTGDCFILKFLTATDKTSFTMMIDCGVWSGAKSYVEPYIKDLLSYVKDDGVDLLVVTHEHKDHVSVFEACEPLFTAAGFKPKQTWMSWSENDSLSKIKKWKTQYGEKKKSLAMASQLLKKKLDDPATKEAILSNQNGEFSLKAKQDFADTLVNFNDLHIDDESFGVAGKEYKGALKGMSIVKKQFSDNIDFKYPGMIIEDLPGAPGVRFNVLGPPEVWTQVKKEVGKNEGDTFAHNDELKKSGAFGMAVSDEMAGSTSSNTLPFDEVYELDESTPTKTSELYKNGENSWRTIEYDWLFSAASLALRINSYTNNLSLVLAIQFTDSERVILFPGDAEFGSWESWHDVDWKGEKGPNGEPYTQYLLNKTVFYKIAHHMSHHGTAEKLGIDMMTHKDLAAMATLDYEVIADKWPNTMPNLGLLQKTLAQTKGRLIVMNENKVFSDAKKKVPIADSIAEAQKQMNNTEKAKFDKAVKPVAPKHPTSGKPLFKQYTVDV